MGGGGCGGRGNPKSQHDLRAKENCLVIEDTVEMTDCHLLSERKIRMNLKPKESYFINFNLIYRGILITALKFTKLI